MSISIIAKASECRVKSFRFNPPPTPSPSSPLTPGPPPPTPPAHPYSDANKSASALPALPAASLPSAVPANAHGSPDRLRASDRSVPKASTSQSLWPPRLEPCSHRRAKTRAAAEETSRSCSLRVDAASRLLPALLGLFRLAHPAQPIMDCWHRKPAGSELHAAPLPESPEMPRPGCAASYE